MKWEIMFDYRWKSTEIEGENSFTHSLNRDLRTAYFGLGTILRTLEGTKEKKISAAMEIVF